MDVLLTGAHGTVGTAITEYLADWRTPHRRSRLDAAGDYDFTLLDWVGQDDLAADHPHADRDCVVADVVDAGAVREAVAGHDAVVHLAGYPATDGSFEEVLANNVRGTHNVLTAAVEAGVESVVFASSNHAVGMFEVENAPGLYERGDRLVDHESPFRPDSEYGSSKAAGEVWGRQYAENEGLRFYALRIGSVRDPPHDHPYGDAERGVARGDWDRDDSDYEEQVARMKRTWQSRRDLAHLVERCLADRSVTWDAFYGVSDNADTWFDLDHARDVVGYDPVDDGSEWTAPPE